MKVSESIDHYHRLKAAIPGEEIASLVAVARSLRLPQRAVASALYSFYASKLLLHIEPDDTVLHAACVSLACRICEVHRPTEKILAVAASHFAVPLTAETHPLYIKSIFMTEVDICVTLDFELDPPEYYALLKTLSKEHGLCADRSRRCWVMINDALATPLPIFFTVPELLFGCFLLEFAASQNEPEPGELDSDEALLEQFYRAMGGPDVSRGAVHFVASEIMACYELNGR